MKLYQAVIIFSAQNLSTGFKLYQQSQLDEILTPATCEIASSLSNDHSDSYVSLSPASLSTLTKSSSRLATSPSSSFSYRLCSCSSSLARSDADDLIPAYSFKDDISALKFDLRISSSSGDQICLFGPTKIFLKKVQKPNGDRSPTKNRVVSFADRSQRHVNDDIITITLGTLRRKRYQSASLRSYSTPQVRLSSS